MYGSISVFALVAGIASAIHEPVGEPSGNPFRTPALNQIVPACKSFRITWDATTKNPISIQLLRGPSNNIIPLGAPLVEGIANTGSFEWTPSSSLEADVTHYGLRIIDDVNGQFQWSSQFGISKGKDCESTSSSTGSLEGYPVASSTPSSLVSSTPSSLISKTTSVTSAIASSTAAISNIATSTFVPSTGLPANSTTLSPSKSMTVPSSLRNSTATATNGESTPPLSTGAAGQVRAALGLAGAIAGLVMML
ncbi:hypothetical protein GQ43DRAFT_369975 [Delitschia confertaspora ATCC 74209]|uniref:Yeast cell wall synthesis Kre9/Knh1-like N-terminal domain-containing protein n=1 Tax=Delitschia confertaspora ATCC 74209 TaxID=1513339 RepID=A0A9P4JPK6_9PLEO|nr:hypothetical protein GQ43DRAFT_369975 [Delitschia confertaspora ATCC 74209]